MWLHCQASPPTQFDQKHLIRHLNLKADSIPLRYRKDLYSMTSLRVIASTTLLYTYFIRTHALQVIVVDSESVCKLRQFRIHVLPWYIADCQQLSRSHIYHLIGLLFWSHSVSWNSLWLWEALCFKRRLVRRDSGAISTSELIRSD